MGEKTAPRTLAELLRGWSDEQLRRLFSARPDLTTPAPHDSAALASRAATRNSVLQAMDQLTRFELFVLDALVVAGQTSRDELTRMVHADSAPVVAAVSRLEDLLLVWESAQGMRPLSGVVDVLSSRPMSGLQRVSPHRTSDEQLTAQLAALTPRAHALLTHVVDHGSVADPGKVRTVPPEAAASPQEELVARRLLRVQQPHLAVVPGEVGLLLRGGRTTAQPLASCPPELATTDRDPTVVERSAAGTAFEMVRRVEMVLEEWGQRPPPMLRAGGLGARDLKAVARMLQVAEPAAALVVMVARSARLVSDTREAHGREVWAPTDAFDTWTDLPPAERWLALAKGWLHGTEPAGLVGTRDSSGKTYNAFLTSTRSHDLPEDRRRALLALAELPAGACLATGTGVASLVARLRWQRPRRSSAEVDRTIAWTVEEAAALGILGLGGLTAAGRELVGEHPNRAVALIEPHLPAPVDHVLLQADLTAVAPGPLVGDLARTLHLVADVESRGGASVHRFSTASLRRAFDSGWSAADLHALLDRISRTPVPQALHYLVDDVARTFGTVRAGYAEAFLVSEEESALTELLHRPGADELGLRRIAPTVVITATPLEELVPRLREWGLAPVVEGLDGTVRVTRPASVRARTPGAPVPPVRLAHDAARVAATVSAVRSGDRVAEDDATGSPGASTPAGVLALLREAVETRATVLVSYLDNHGSSTQRLVEPTRVEGGQLTAWDQRTSSMRNFAVHRISEVSTREG